LTEHDLSHLIVLEPGSGRPLGVLSTLDIARVVGNGSRRGRHHVREPSSNARQFRWESGR
jgi:hypothetical protein